MEGQPVILGWGKASGRASRQLGTIGLEFTWLRSFRIWIDGDASFHVQHSSCLLGPSLMLTSSQSCNRYVATSKALTSTAIPVPSVSMSTSSRSSSNTFVFHAFLTGILPHRSRPLLFPPNESKILTITLRPFRFGSSPKLTSSSSSPRLTQSITKFFAPSM